mmetsp:Transcript_37150/g.119152  ORF Transcript_37150/g.119152 Transcript_37150/m.119152 type:complete len:340 (+) Transcript_37150:1074-2093(+)
MRGPVFPREAVRLPTPRGHLGQADFFFVDDVPSQPALRDADGIRRHGHRRVVGRGGGRRRVGGGGRRRRLGRVVRGSRLSLEKEVRGVEEARDEVAVLEGVHGLGVGVEDEAEDVEVADVAETRDVAVVLALGELGHRVPRAPERQPPRGVLRLGGRRHRRRPGEPRRHDAEARLPGRLQRDAPRRNACLREGHRRHHHPAGQRRPLLHRRTVRRDRHRRRRRPPGGEEPAKGRSVGGPSSEGPDGVAQPVDPLPFEVDRRPPEGFLRVVAVLLRAVALVVATRVVARGEVARLEVRVLLRVGLVVVRVVGREGPAVVLRRKVEGLLRLAPGRGVARRP